jgi:hypothetical protein
MRLYQDAMAKNKKKKDLEEERKKKIQPEQKKAFNDRLIQVGFCKEYAAATLKAGIPEEEKKINNDQLSILYYSFI